MLPLARTHRSEGAARSGRFAGAILVVFALASVCATPIVQAASAAGQSDKKSRSSKKGRGNKKASADSWQEKEFERVLAKFEKEKELQPYERIPTIQAFGKAPCKRTVDFLKGLLKSESNIGILTAVCRALTWIKSADAIQVVLTDAIPKIAAMPSSGFALGQIGQMLQGPMSSEAEEWLLSRGLRIPALRKNETVFPLLLEAAAARHSPKRIPVLSKEIRKTRDPKLQAKLLVALAEKPSSSVVKLASSLVRHPEKDVSIAAWEVLGGRPTKSLKKQYVRGLKHRVWEVRAICADALGRIGGSDVVELLTPLLDDKDKRVQIAVVDALAHRGGREVIEPLFRAIDRTSGRVQDDIADALARLTGKNFGPQSAQWESWWGVYGPKLKDAELVRRTAEEFVAIKEGEKDKATLLYYGLRVLSDYVTFVIDCSESMKEEYVPAKEKEKAANARRTGKTVVDTPEEKKKRADAEKNAKKQRIKVAKDELTGVVTGLKEGTSFNIVRFDTFVVDFVRNTLASGDALLKKMDEKLRPMALQFVYTAKPAGLTNLSGALESAFGYEDVDTIFLLSDGAPTVGITEPELFLRTVKRWNRLRKIKINVIGFDLKPNERALLRELADQNFGVFVER